MRFTVDIFDSFTCHTMSEYIDYYKNYGYGSALKHLTPHGTIKQAERLLKYLGKLHFKYL